MAANVSYTNDERGLTLNVQVYEEEAGTVEVSTDGTLTITCPDGKVFATVKGVEHWEVNLPKD